MSMVGSGRKLPTGLAFAISRAALLFCVVIVSAVGIDSSLAKPLVGISTQISVWLLASYFWLVALIELSPWPLLYKASGRPGYVEKAIAFGSLLALLLFYTVDQRAGQPIGLFAIIPALASFLLRLFLGLKGIELWKGIQPDSPDRSG